MRAAASALLAALKDRDDAGGKGDDIAAMALCYEGALDADPTSAETWHDLKSAAAELASVRDQAKYSGDLAQARSVLDQFGAATQPTTSPASAH